MPPSRRHRSCANLVRERELNTCQSNQHVVRARAVFHKTRSREARAHTAVLPHNRATCGGFWPLLEHQPQPHQLPSVTSVLLRALSRHAHTCMHIHACTYMPIHAHTYMHAHTCMHIHACPYMHIHACTYIHAHTYMHIHAHTCTYMHIHWRVLHICRFAPF